MTLVPPAIYDHMPNMPVIEYVATREEINKYCIYSMGLPVPPSDRKWEGCNVARWGICYIYIINDDLVRRHEWAHCNGWKHEDEIKAYLGKK